MITMTMIDSRRTALLLVDVQPDFMPGGSLPVTGGDEIVPALGDLMSADTFALQVATQDWHPSGHISFASQHPGRRSMDVIQLYGHDQVLWPDHCVQGSPGADLHREVPWEHVSVIIRKGEDPQTDSYSGFRNNWNSDGERPRTGLAGYLRERGITTLAVCGLARDVCVKWTAEDAARDGFETYVLWDLTRGVNPSADDAVRADLERAGVHVISSVDLA
jgi:nicotinamidase/pyrazinamidase